MKNILFCLTFLFCSTAFALVEMFVYTGNVAQGYFGDASIVINDERIPVSPAVLIHDIKGNIVKIIPPNTTIQYERNNTNEANAPISQIWIVEQTE